MAIGIRAVQPQKSFFQFVINLNSIELLNLGNLMLFIRFWFNKS